MQGTRDVPRWARRALGTVGSLLVIAAIAGCETTTTGDDSEAATSGDAVKCGNVATDDCTPHVGSRQAVRVDALVWRVRAVETTPTIGDQQYGLGETANGVYLVADLSVTSRKNESATISDDVISLVVDGGNVYSPDSDGTFAAMTEGQDPLLLTDIGPDTTLSAPVVFDVPPKVLGKKLELRFSELGFGSTEGFIRLPALQ